jgi:hypothetical protein
MELEGSRQDEDPSGRTEPVHIHSDRIKIIRDHPDFWVAADNGQHIFLVKNKKIKNTKILAHRDIFIFPN